jgi:hypothetical protein
MRGDSLRADFADVVLEGVQLSQANIIRPFLPSSPFFLLMSFVPVSQILALAKPMGALGEVLLPLETGKTGEILLGGPSDADILLSTTGDSLHLVAVRFLALYQSKPAIETGVLVGVGAGGSLAQPHGSWMVGL